MFLETVQNSSALAELLRLHKFWQRRAVLAQCFSDFVIKLRELEIVSPSEFSSASGISIDVRQAIGSGLRPGGTEKGLDKFTLRLSGLLDEEPVEDGRTHPAEEVLQQAVEAHGASSDRWIADLVYGAGSDSRSGAILRLAARCDLPRSNSIRAALLGRALQSASIELRDAAVQAAETWMDDSMVEILLSHQEGVEWLGRYKDQVIADLCAQ